MKRIRFDWLAAVLLLSAQAAPAQTYPSRPIRAIVPFSPGSASDIVARLIGPKLQESWGQQVVVDNRPSGGGIVAGGIVAAAAPDGHTIMITSSQFAGAAALYDKLPYDPLQDFTAVAQTGSTPFLLLVAPGLGVKSVSELIALAKQKPGYLTFGSSGIASGTHYAGELFKLAAGIDVVHVPYKGVPEVLTDVMTGRIQYAAMPVLPSMPLVRSGRLLALGVMSAQRVSVLPEAPTIAEAALPGFECDGWYGVFVPSRTPRAIVTRLAQELSRILQLPDVKERYESQGAIAKSTTPEAFGQMVRDEIALRTKVFRAARAKPD